MSGIRGVLKDGWHPKGKDGGQESWRGDFKGINQVAGWVGKGKSGDSSAGTQRVARPLSSLKDPSTFAPPPRRMASASTSDSAMPGVAAKPRPPPVPVRSNTSDTPTPHPTETNSSARVNPQPKPKPALPPRLPPRRAQPEEDPSSTSPPPPAYQDIAAPQLNTRAIGRLANAGVSVPAFGIQRGAGNSTTETERPSRQQFNPQSELSSRFARMSTPSSPATPPISASTLTTAANAATAAAPLLQNHATNSHGQTASPHPSQQQNSSEISAEDMAKAAAAANKFRERHNDSIQAGMRKFNTIDQKYGIKKRINEFIEDQKSPAYPAPNQQQPQQQGYQPPPPQPYNSPPANTVYTAPSRNTSRPDLEALNKRKPPPPPPPPKPTGLSAAPKAVSQPGSAPPLPLDTKPR